MAVSNPHTQGCTLSHTVRAFVGDHTDHVLAPGTDSLNPSPEDNGSALNFRRALCQNNLSGFF